MAHELLTAGEVAEIFRVSEATVGQWRRDGKIAAVALPGGKGYRFARTEVDRLLEPTEATA